MKAVILAIILAVSGSIGFAGVASAQAGPPSDAAGYWQWIIDHSVPEEPSIPCCPVGPAKPRCPGAPSAPSLPACPPSGLRALLQR